LPEAVASALQQEGVETEVIVVDDSSEDATPTVLRELADGRVRAVRTEINVGLAVARNTGLRLAETEWVAFLDDDDLWSPRKLQTQIHRAAVTNAPWAYSSAVMLNSVGEVVYEFPALDPEAILELLLERNAVAAGASNVVVRTDFVRGLGGFDERFSRLADWDLWIRLATAAIPVASTEYLVAYRQHGNNLSGSGGREALREFDALVEKHRDRSERLGVSFDRARVESWIDVERQRAARIQADGHMRNGRRLRAAGILFRSAVSQRNLRIGRDAAAVLAGQQPNLVGPRRPLYAKPAWLRNGRVAAGE